MRFIKGHNLEPLCGPDNPRWNGGEYISHGYRMLRDPDHPRPGAHGYVYEHVVVAETALGKPLPVGAEVHHVNGDKLDNRPSNLVVCQDHSYHMLLHAREKKRARQGVST